MTQENILAPVAQLSLPDSAALSGSAQRLLAFVESYTIATAEDYSLAGDELRAIKARAVKLEEQRTAITGPINQALRAVNALFKQPAELLERAERALKGKMLAYSQEQERIAAEARRKAEAAAEAERQRLAAEAAAREAEAREQARKAAEAAAAGNAEAAAIAQAEAQRAQAEAQTVAATAQMIVAPVVTVAPPAAKGISTAKKVDFEVVDLHALVKHVAERPELLALLRADEVKLRAYVRGLGLSCNLPGVRVFEDRVMSARAA